MTIQGWMVYGLAVSVPIAAGAWLLERGAAGVRAPTRWIWLGALALSIGLPVSAALWDASVEGRAALPAMELGGTRPAIAPAPAAEGEPAGFGDGGLDGMLALLGQWRAEADRALSSAAASLPTGDAAARWLAGLWGTASLILGAIVLGSMLRLRRNAEAWPERTMLGRRVRVSPDLGPATLGLFRPTVVIPHWILRLESRELDLVLSHEDEHARSRDPLVLTLGLLPAIAFPWNPLIWWQVRRLKDAVEVDCDRRVLRKGAPAPRYGDLLLRLGTRARRAPLPVPTMTGPTSLLERRLTAMKKTRLWTAIPRAVGATALASGMVVLACTTEAPVSTESAAATEEIQASALEDQSTVLGLWMRRDGSVYVNDELHPVDRLADVVAPVYAAAQADLVVAIGGDPATPYRVVAELERQLQAVGATRVVFLHEQTEPPFSLPDDVSELADEGVAFVLPSEGMSVPSSGRNLLHLEVQLSGVVDVRRGESRQVQRVRPGDVDDLWRHEAERLPNPRRIAAVKTHPEARYSLTVQVLDALRAAEATRISLQTLEE